jgi:hypothetical protein
MRRNICVLLVILVEFCGVALGQGGPPKEPCVTPAHSAIRIERPGEDWPLAFIRKDRILKRSPFDSEPGGEAGFVATAYAVSARPVLLPYITINECDKTAVLSGLTLKPNGALAISKNGRTFAYIVWGALVTGTGSQSEGVGADINVVFYDLHGNGHFDTVQVGSLKRLPFVPEWVK